MADEPACMVCGGSGRYVRHPQGEVPLAYCSEHAPAATSPWIYIAQAVLVLAILGIAGFRLWGWFRS